MKKFYPSDAQRGSLGVGLRWSYRYPALAAPSLSSPPAAAAATPPGTQGTSTARYVSGVRLVVRVVAWGEPGALTRAAGCACAQPRGTPPAATSFTVPLSLSLPLSLFLSLSLSYRVENARDRGEGAFGLYATRCRSDEWAGKNL